MGGHGDVSFDTISKNIKQNPKVKSMHDFIILNEENQKEIIEENCTEFSCSIIVDIEY